MSSALSQKIFSSLHGMTSYKTSFIFTTVRSLLSPVRVSAFTGFHVLRCESRSLGGAGARYMTSQADFLSSGFHLELVTRRLLDRVHSGECVVTHQVSFSYKVCRDTRMHEQGFKMMTG
jgi:hypothetical protein